MDGSPSTGSRRGPVTGSAAEALPECVELRPGWVRNPEEVLGRLLEETAWGQHAITLFGRTVPTPRLTAWTGEHAYRYSGIVNEPRPWSPTLQALRDRLVAELGAPFDSCLANLYRDGADSMGWHSDDEPELGPRPTIASVSLGARRRFLLRHRASGQRWSVELGEGDLLVMRDESQSDYRHAVPKTTRALGPRMNLTFRCFSPLALPGFPPPGG
jgi:alkylated DNA repair dioxygenase AlkB